MSKYISIDGGTTNTRISLIIDKNIISTKKYSIGAGAGAEGQKILIPTVAQGISELLAENHLTENDIDRILASGMITSEFGLHLLPHQTVPVGIREMKATSEEVSLPDISSIPFVFMRGVKTTCESLETADMMRGEETEIMGIASHEYGKCIYALMGSHTKMVKTDINGKITEFVTMMTGELCAAAAHNTILKNAFVLEESSLDSEYLLKGFEYAQKKGVSEALFKVRILKNLFTCTDDQAYSFFIGIILLGDAEYALNSDAETVVIAGNKALRYALAAILEKKSDSRIITLSGHEVENSVSMGQIKIYETTL